MIEKVLPELYKIEIPLPGSSLKSLNAYLIKGEERNLLVDTGFDLKVCKEAMVSALHELQANIEDTDIFITHFHPDHSGLTHSLLTEKSKAYMGARDVERIRLLRNTPFQDEMDRLLCLNGFPRQELAKLRERDSYSEFRFLRNVSYTAVNDGDTIQAGIYNFTCIASPGHSPGHICLYDEEKKALLCGDHILNGISPNIAVWLEMPDSLGYYLNSLDKINELDVRLALPAHRGLITDCRIRISEIKLHHQKRLEEISSVMKNEEMMSAYFIASKLSWNISIKNWDSFPTKMKWFATSEVISHLEHLEAKRLVSRIQKNGQDYFVLNGNLKSLSMI